MTNDSSNANPVAHLVALAKKTVPPMHPAGWPFVAGSALLTLLLRRFSGKAGLLGFVITAWCAWFFREPQRVTPTESNVVVAAADGTICAIDTAAPPAELGLSTTPLTRISVFLSIFDVHVQRAPVSGNVLQKAYRPGKFLSADLDKASSDNERNSLLLRTNSGAELVVTQIAGLVARRIVCPVNVGDQVNAGQTYGLIRFGSRVDVYLPQGSRVLVQLGQRTIGGETRLAELPAAGA